MSDDANITGRGADILLPPQGNPFKATASGEPADLTPAEVESQFSPTFGSLDAGMGKAMVAPETDSQDGIGGIEEPTDLTPADIAAMFPASQDERNAVPEADEPDAEPRPMFEAEPSPEVPVTEPASEIDASMPGARAAWMFESTLQQGARAPMAIPSSDPGRQPKNYNVDINSFNPDAPIGKPRRKGMGKSVGRMGKVEIEAFDPDAPVTASDMGEMDANMTLGASEPDASSIKADLESPATPEPMFAPQTPLSDFDTGLVAGSIPPTTDGFVPPMDMPTEPSLTSNVPAPIVGFQPFDPFAPTGERALPPSIPSPSIASSSVEAPSTQPITVTQVETGSSATTVETGTSASTVATHSVTTRVTTGQVTLDDSIIGADGSAGLPVAPPIALPVMETQEMLDQLVTKDLISELWQRIDTVEKQVVEDENSLPGQRTKNFDKLKTARNLLLGGRVNYEDALRYISEVDADYRYAGRVRQWSSTYGWLLGLYDLAWVAILIFLAFRGTDWVVQASIAGGANINQETGSMIWYTVLWGGFGAIIKSAVALREHITKQDFDVQHMMWYVTSPFIGAMFGAFVYAFALLFIIGTGAVVGLQRDNVTANAGYVFYLLSFIVGFQQNLVLDLIDRVKDAILPPKDKPKDKDSSTT